MRIFNTLFKVIVFYLSLSAMSLQAETAIYDESNLQLNLPSVAIVSDGKIQGYFSVNLQVLSNTNKRFAVLDNTYATALLGPVKTLPSTENVSATYQQDDQRLIIPAFALKSAGINVPTNALTLRVLATLDNVFILGL